MNTSLLKKICETPGTSGFENRIRNLIITELDKAKKSYSIDNMGNLTVLIKGKNQTKKVMLGAHMDEIGFIVTHIDENGFIKQIINILGLPAAMIKSDAEVQQIREERAAAQQEQMEMQQQLAESQVAKNAAPLAKVVQDGSQ